MRYKIFGRQTGLRVSELALGAGNFGTRWGHGAERADAKQLFDAYVEAGGNFIDTADNYQFGESEEIVGDFIAADRDHFVLATKYTLGTNDAHGVSRTGNSRKNMVRSVEGSLKRLKTDRIDLYWAHFADGMTPMEEIVRAFDDLVRAGKIHYAGLSNFPAWRVARADLLAELRGWAPIAGIQVEYSLAERTADRELLPMAEALGLGVALWSPARRRLSHRQISPEQRGTNQLDARQIGPHGKKRPRNGDSGCRDRNRQGDRCSADGDRDCVAAAQGARVDDRMDSDSRPTHRRTARRHARRPGDETFK
jgi:aryl-alcohol dehydrogenase-like predicted oxidoreductase